MTNNKKYPHGLMVARFQPFHLGHAKVLDVMLLQCEQVSVVIGSIQESKTAKNPLTFEQRQSVINAYLSEKNALDKVQIIGQADINDDDNWTEVVLATVAEHYQRNQLSYLPVTAYFSGSLADSRWYIDKIPNIEIVDRMAGELAGVSATKIRTLYCQGDDGYQKWLPDCTLPVMQYIVCD